MDEMVKLDNPLLIDDQLSPPSVLRKIPVMAVPAKRCPAAFTTSGSTLVLVNPVGIHVLPPSGDLMTPLPWRMGLAVPA
jgi:hypothetical protein